jgi:hypothetical protein
MIFTPFTGMTPSAHGALTGLGNDDHTQYGLLAGRAGGQTLNGGLNASDQLTIVGSAGGTDTIVIQTDDHQINMVAGGIFRLEATGAGDFLVSSDAGFQVEADTGNKTFNMPAAGNEVAINCGADGFDVQAYSSSKFISMLGGDLQINTGTDGFELSCDGANKNFQIPSGSDINIEGGADGFSVSAVSSTKSFTLPSGSDSEINAGANGFSISSESSNMTFSMAGTGITIDCAAVGGSDIALNSDGKLEFATASGNKKFELATAGNQSALDAGADDLQISAIGGAKSIVFSTAGTSLQVDGGADGFELNCVGGAKGLNFQAAGSDTLIECGADGIQINAVSSGKYLHLLNGSTSVIEGGTDDLEIKADGGSEYLQLFNAGSVLEGGTILTLQAGGESLAMSGAGCILTSTGQITLNALADITLNPGGNDIDLTVTNTAPAGGAAATLGLTGGGAGIPAAAAQAGWVQIKVGGATGWIPWWQ